MTSRKALLSKLLQPLVEEWGLDVVEAALKSVGGPASCEINERIRNQRTAKPLASEQVAQMQLPEPQASTLKALAIRFDQKQFLPSVSDVREFLIMSDERPGAMKDRSAAFKRLLVVLTRLPQERLERLANSSRHSGPSRLGPLSDAIGSAANSLPRYVRQEKEAA
jgi:hypothetical protein